MLVRQAPVHNIVSRIAAPVINESLFEIILINTFMSPARNNFSSKIRYQLSLTKGASVPTCMR